MDTLNSNAVAFDEWKASLARLRAMLAELQAAWEKPAGDCTGLPQYDKDLEGDGLAASYYANADMDGDPQTRIDARVKFFWANEEPIAGVSPNLWSVVWSGYLKPPKQDTYTFFCESDDGCVIELNNSVILRDNVPEGKTTDYLQYKRQLLARKIKDGEWDDFIKPPSLDEPDRFPRAYSSLEMPLDANTYVPIKVKAVHSVHNSLTEDGNSWVYLYWQSEKIRKQVIPQQYLFTKIKSDPLKPTNYDSMNLYLDTLAENDNAFMDKVTWKIK